MKNNKGKNNLDEMQEQKLLQIEHRGFWFGFWGLFISMAVQMVACGNKFQYVLGEWVVFMFLCIYLCGACLRNGIWDRRLKADVSTNIIASLVAGVVMAVIMFASAFLRSGKLIGSICAGIFSGGMVFVICLFVLSIFAKAYEKRRDELEAEDPEE